MLDVTVKILKSLGYKVNTTEDVKSYNDTINVINDFGNLTLNIEGSRDGESTSRVMLSSALLPLPFKLIINIKALH